VKLTDRGASQSVQLPSALAAALRALSQQAGVPLFMTLLAAFQVLLARCTEQRDILVGLPLAHRPRAELDGLIGCFVNTLVLRTDLSGNLSFRELVQRVRQECIGAYAHQALPFEQMVEALPLEREASHNPLLQVMFVLQDAAGRTIELPGLSTSPLEVDSGTVTSELTLLITEGADSLTATFKYSSDVFEAPTITRMLGHWQTLLAGAVAQPGQSILTLPLLTQAERQQLLVKWNNNQRAYPRECLHEVFEAQVARTPEQVALVCGEKRLTYRALNDRANQVAQRVRELGVGPEVLVGLSLEHGPELIIGILGILKAGGACVPLDPTYPPERLAFLLADTQVPVLLTQRHLLGKLPEHSARVVCLDAGTEIFTRESTAPVVSGVTNDNLAFVFYTSGSSGKPKGVMLSHRGRYTRQSTTPSVYHLTPADHHLLKAPIGFTLVLREILWPLLAGAPLIIAQPGERQDSASLVKLMAAHQIAIVHLVPSQLHMLLEEEGLQTYAGLKYVVCTGEPVSTELQERCFARLPAALSSYYGSTEAPSAAVWHYRREEPQRRVRLGRPNTNKQIYVLDALLQPVPVGVPGEVYVGGKGLARGYLNQPGLTAEKFLPDPFSAEPGARLYRTGDRARYLPDGSLEFLGRLDQQVKIRGVRVEPGEIEAVLSRHPLVRECVMLAREDGRGGNWLVAYVVPRRARGIASSGLRRFLQERVPD
jgi:amino acid adenylation domain-containing protein